MGQIFKSVTISFAAALLFLGCGAKSKSVSYDMGGSVRANSVVGATLAPKAIDLTVAKKLSTVLTELGSIEGSVYFLKSDDFQVHALDKSSSDLLKIDSFPALKRYIENTTSYTIEIVKNRFIQDDMKVVKVFNKDAVKNSLPGHHSSLKEVIQNNNGLTTTQMEGIDISMPNTLTTVLKKLSKITRESYYCEDEINIPSSNVKIIGLEHLDQYLRQVSEYGLVISRDSEDPSIPKVIKVLSINQIVKSEK